MIFIMILEFAGILLFSLTSLRVRQLKTNLDVECLLKENLDSMTWYLYEIDNVLIGDIPGKMYDGAIESMKNAILFSTVNVFKNWPFYKVLTPKLKDKVVKTVLNNLFEKTMYYFCDFNAQIFAPDTFVRAILTSLDFRIFVEGQKIIKKGGNVTHLNFFFKGEFSLYGYGSY